MSKIEIINRALLKLGEPPVSSLNDAAFGKSYAMIYDDLKDLLLSSYPWRFSVAVKEVACCEEKFGEKYMFRLPVDCLLLLNVYGVGVKDLTGVRPFSIEEYGIANNCIVLLSKNPISVEYVKRVSDDVVFPPLFREALAAKIAAELAMRIKHSLNIKQVFDNEFFMLIRQAELNNEIAKGVELLGDNSWLLARREVGLG